MNELLIATKIIVLKIIASVTVQKIFFSLVGGGILIMRRGANKREAAIIVAASVTVGLGLGYILENVIKVVIPAIDISRIMPLVYVLAGIISYDTVLRMVDKSPHIVDGAGQKIEDALRKKKL